jgi:hypothetical protein
VVGGAVVGGAVVGGAVVGAAVVVGGAVVVLVVVVVGARVVVVVFTTGRSVVFTSTFSASLDPPAAHDDRATRTPTTNTRRIRFMTSPTEPPIWPPPASAGPYALGAHDAVGGQHRLPHHPSMMRHTGEMLATLSSRSGAIAEACRRFDATSLTVFGSAATDTYHDNSDVDLLVTFAPDSPVSRFDAYFGLKEALEAILGRPVDLVTPSALDNPYFAESVESSRIDLSAA